MIPKDLLEELKKDSYYKKCVRHAEGKCQGRITFEHSHIHAGKQIQAKWAIIPLCAFHHEVDNFQDNGDLNKELNQMFALNRATDLELEAISKAIDYKQRRKYLNAKYLEYQGAGYTKGYTRLSGFGKNSSVEK